MDAVDDVDSERGSNLGTFAFLSSVCSSPSALKPNPFEVLSNLLPDEAYPGMCLAGTPHNNEMFPTVSSGR